MKTKITLLFIALALIISCTNKSDNKNKTVQDIVTETPEALDDNLDYDFGSISKRYDSNIISKLYKEALEKNIKLQELNNKIAEMHEINSDSLSEYRKFTQVNNNYWTSAKSYANGIQDSILKTSTLKFIEDSESIYESKMANHEQKQLSIDAKSNLLDDKLIIMKIAITKSMIDNYQKNEQPAIKTLENIIKKYDSLIKATEPYTKNIN